MKQQLENNETTIGIKWDNNWKTMKKQLENNEKNNWKTMKKQLENNEKTIGKQ